MKNLYEILIPVNNNKNEEFDTDTVGTLETKLIEVSGWYTKLFYVDGVWIDEGKEYKDLNIPYRVLVERKDFINLLKFAKENFNQKAVMGYKISDYAIIYP